MFSGRSSTEDDWLSTSRSLAPSHGFVDRSSPRRARLTASSFSVGQSQSMVNGSQVAVLLAECRPNVRNGMEKGHGVASQPTVIRVTEDRAQLWHNCRMKNVGARANILKVSESLKSSLEAAGSHEHYPAAHVLFREDGNSVGVYLVLKGKVRMSVRNLPNLDRDFAAGTAGYIHRAAVQPDRGDPYRVRRGACTTG